MPEQKEREESSSESKPGLKKKIAEVIRKTVMPKINTVENTAEDNSEEIAELREAHSQLQDEMQTLREMHAAIAGLADSEETTAKKRRRDLLTALERKAEGSGGYAEMDYNEVTEQWRILGHGDRDPKQAYRAMNKLGDLEGVEYKKNSRPKVVRINLEEFDASTVSTAFDNVNNFEAAKGGQNAVTHGD